MAFIDALKALTTFRFFEESGLVPLSFVVRAFQQASETQIATEVRVLSAKERQLLEAMEPQAAQKGVEIVTIEIVGAKKSPTIRVYIDAEGGVSFDALATSQKWMGELLDEIDPFPGAYTLEVSSPGIDRPLRTPEHFCRFAGETVKVKTTAPIDNTSSFCGTLRGMEGNDVAIEVDGAVVRVPLGTIKRARVKGTIEF